MIDMMIVAVTDRKHCKDLMEQIGSMTDLDAVILREKDLDPKEYLELAKTIKKVCENKGMKFIINTFIDVARELKVGSIQLPLDIFRNEHDETSYFDPIWVSVHSVEEAIEAEKLGADLIIYGNVFETACKPGAGPKGLKELERVCSSVDIPVLGIGGINVENASSVVKAGARGVCIMSGLMDTDRPSDLISRIRDV